MINAWRRQPWYDAVLTPVNNMTMTFGHTAELPKSPFNIKLHKNIYIGVCKEVSVYTSNINKTFTITEAKYIAKTTVSNTFLDEPISLNIVKTKVPEDSFISDVYL